MTRTVSVPRGSAFLVGLGVSLLVVVWVGGGIHYLAGLGMIGCAVCRIIAANADRWASGLLRPAPGTPIPPGSVREYRFAFRIAAACCLFIGVGVGLLLPMLEGLLG